MSLIILKLGLLIALTFMACHIALRVADAGSDE